MSSVDKDIGRLIRKAREHLKLTPEDVAEELGISSHRLIQMEFGELRPTPYQLLCFCAVLRVQPSWFFPEGWMGAETSSADEKKSSDSKGFMREVLNDDHSGSAARRPIEVAFSGGITILVGRDFDQIAFSRVVEVLRIS